MQSKIFFLGGKRPSLILNNGSIQARLPEDRIDKEKGKEEEEETGGEARCTIDFLSPSIYN